MEKVWSQGEDMIRYWKYIIQPLAEQNNYKKIALYNSSRELFWDTFEYCKNNKGILYLLNNYDFLDKTFLDENHEYIKFGKSENIFLECQIVLADQSFAYKDEVQDFRGLHLNECAMFVSKIHKTEQIANACVTGGANFCFIKSVPFGGAEFWVDSSLKDELNSLLHGESFWNKVEEERKQLEDELKKKTLNSFTQRSKIYNAEEVLRKEEINKVRVYG